MFDLNNEREAFIQTEFNTFGLDVNDFKTTGEYFMFIGWLMRSELEKAKAQAVPETHTHSITLTCAELKEAYDFGAPDESQDQMTDLVTIGWHENGHSGAGYYAYMTECEDEGSIKLGESESGAANE
ncbi:hypothetical protein BFR95_01175 [Acinetobacter pittii]|uniref:hypothetical protein n=1 Tax=Acinetobacter pittii TaxID=48296 RepID=UPI0008397EDC|nr:hypothetical protein [Acinetobacter pittii]OCZ10402.1 hypothetical protein BFR95_01175 [Acinetobacter pittii]